jgi:hypothetical protein
MTGPAEVARIRRMKLFHIGAHKTGTTTLQHHLFRNAGLPYFGMEVDGEWRLDRIPWLQYLLEEKGELPTRERAFIFSEEGLLLRAGMQGATALAKQIASLADTSILITIREPSALLKSAYYQSLPLRGSALGYSEGRQLWPAPSTRYQDFSEWWGRQQEAIDISLAGLLNYSLLYEKLRAVLGAQRIRFLPVEWLQDRPKMYAQSLVNLGFPSHLVDKFLNAPAENTSHGKRLKYLHPAVYKLFKQSRVPRHHWLEWVARKPILGTPVTRLMYSGSEHSVGAPSKELLTDIRRSYAQHWHFALSIAERGLVTVPGSIGQWK